MIEITVYGKPGCCLCDDARAAVAEVRAERDLAVREVDVSSDPELHREYGERIPVIAAGGRELLELEVSADRLRAALDDLAGPSGPGEAAR